MVVVPKPDRDQMAYSERLRVAGDVSRGRRTAVTVVTREIVDIAVVESEGLDAAIRLRHGHYGTGHSVTGSTSTTRSTPSAASMCWPSPATRVVSSGTPAPWLDGSG